ncbi:MAG: hypothetical protein H0T85_07100, partial [Geodermatophilaceae bacterium]|nr:hypothetical protein [Geodermatophilaceae bacterium]
VARATLGTGFFEPIDLGTASADLDSSADTVTPSFRISVNKPSQVGMIAELRASSSAKGKGNSASTSADVQGVTFSYQKIG